MQTTLAKKAPADHLDFEAIFEATPGLYLILSPDFRIVGVNEAYCRATMTKREEIVGRGLFEVFPDNPDDPNADGTRNLRLSLERVIRFRRPDAMAIQKYDIRKPLSEGGEYEVRYWSPLNSPVFDSQNTIRWIIHRAEDVTQLVRLRAEGEASNKLAQEQQRIIDRLRSTTDELHQSEIRFQALADNLPGVVFRRIMSPDGRSRDVYVSAGIEKILGVAPQEIMSGRATLLDFTHPEDRDRKIQALKTGTLLMQPVLVEVRKVTRPEGAIRWWQISAMPMRLDNGDIQWDCIALDITERKTAEEQLRQAQKMDAIGQLTGGVAHDFNNLLTVILSNADTLAEELSDNEGLRGLAEMTRAAAERGANLTGSLLSFARRQTLTPQVVDINKLIADMENLIRRTLGDNIEIQTFQANDLWQAVVDPAQLESALLNLALNARDAMPNGGKLTVDTANFTIDQDYSEANEAVAPGDYVVLSIADTGTGMSSEVAARAFEPFFSTKEAGKGTGLGLSMVYGFVKQSGGHIKIYTEIGIGTSFKIFLPRALSSRRPAESSDTAEAHTPSGTETVLVAEDDDLVRQHTERVLRSLGYHVISANNGPAALALLERGSHVDLLFTDVIMPGGMSGRQLADKASRLRPSLKILYTSGYTEHAIVHQGHLSPGIHLIRKPYKKKDLALKLRQILGPAA